MAWIKRGDLKNDIIQARHIDRSAAVDFSSTGIKADVIAESTAATGVTIDGLPLKDGYVVALDNQGFKLGTGTDDSVAHNGTNTIWTHTTGVLNFDNTAATGYTVFTLGTDTSATSFQVTNNSNNPVFSVTPIDANTGTTSVYGTLELNGTLNQDAALIATGDAANIAATMSHATQNAEGLYVSLAQITNVRTSGVLSAIKASVTSLSGSTAGTDVYAFEAAVTAGEAAVDHFVLRQGAGFDYTIDATAVATAEAGVLLKANVADAWSMADSTGDYLVIASTTGSESVAVPRRLTTTDGVASGTVRTVGGVASVLVANGTAHTNSTDEAVLASYVIPANTIKSGTVVKVKFLARVSANNSTTTLTPRLRFGTTTLTGTALITGGAVDSDVDHLFTGEFMLVGRAAPSASAAIVGVGSFSQVAVTGGAMISADLPSTNFATDGALRLELTADWAAADANSVRAEIFTVEVIG